MTSARFARASRAFDRGGPDERQPEPLTFAQVTVEHADWRCPCGWGLADAHARRHAEWSCGIPIRCASRLDLDLAAANSYGRDAIVMVRTTASLRWRQLAYDMSRLGARAHGWYVSFEYPGGRQNTSPSAGRAALYLTSDERGNRLAAGFAAVFDSMVDARWHPEWDRPEQADGGTVRPTIGPIFRCPIWRGIGIGTALVEAVAADADIDATDLGWLWPFSDAGCALVRRFVGPSGTVWVR